MIPRLIPVLLLRSGGLYKTTRFEKPVYVGDPVNAVRIFNDKEADEVILLDIDAARTGTSPDFDLISEIAGEAFMPLCYGGGVRHLQDFHALFSAGVEKVAVNTAGHQRPELISEAARRFGSQSVVGSVDVHAHRRRVDTCVRSAKECTRRTPVEHAAALVRAGAGEILLTSVEREGTGEGYDLSLIEEVASSVSVPLIANGGAGSLADAAQALSKGASAAAAGSLFVFQGRHRAVLINYPAQAERMSLLEGRA